MQYHVLRMNLEEILNLGLSRDAGVWVRLTDQTITMILLQKQVAAEKVMGTKDISPIENFKTLKLVNLNVNKIMHVWQLKFNTVDNAIYLYLISCTMVIMMANRPPVM